MSTDRTPRPAGSDARLEDLRAHATVATSARLFLGGPGTSYRTRDLLRLRADHAGAKDALSVLVDGGDPAFRDIAEHLGLVELRTRARGQREYLVRPDLGRRLDDAAAETLRGEATVAADLQIALADGLSPGAVREHGPAVLAGLVEQGQRLGWRVGRPLFVERARVGVMNEIGALTGCRVLVLLIGERPGLQTHRSLSAYLAFRPKPGDTDAQRNLVCNIHAYGVPPRGAVRRVMGLARTMAALELSGIGVKEEPFRSLPDSPTQQSAGVLGH